MAIDPDIANWILEFLFRQPLEDRVLNSLVRSLPLPINNSNLKRLVLLKKIESEVSRNSVSEGVLDLFEQLEEIEFLGGTEVVSDAMKWAYCATAVECTVKPLRVEDNGEYTRKFRFFEAVKRVWRGRVGKMDKALEKGGLGSEELWSWKDEIEAAVWDDTVCENVVKKSAAVDAVEAIGVYLKEEREKLGPSFLELVAEKVKDDKVMQEVFGVGVSDPAAEKESTPPLPDQDMNNNGSKEVQKEIVHHRKKVVGFKRTRGLASGSTRGAKITDSDDEAGPSVRKYELPRSAEVNRIREALESSSLELQAIVKDPLPDALQLAEKLSGMARKNESHVPVEENHVGASLFIVDSAGVVQAKCSVRNFPRPSLMERNSSARVYEWDDSIDGSQEDSESRRSRLQLASPKRLRVSPLNKYEPKSIKRRRQKRKWSTLEEDTLRTGVEKYGRGNWKIILTAYSSIFENRTEVDLKDKWRNMTRY